MSKPLHHQSITELHDSLQQKQFSAVELTEYFLNRIEQLNPELNAIISTNKSYSIKQAQAADQAIKNNSNNYLTGIPIAQKDLFCSKNWRTTCGSNYLKDFIPPYDATVIEKFNAAGAIIIGKANMDEFAMGSSNENSAFGACKNPWHQDHSPGGSSGGSAAAIAAGFAPGATGTDTGGSIRQPAAFCGVTGLRPTYGRVSRYGMVAFASSFDQGGVFARSAEDCAHLLSCMAGHDPKDSTSSQQPTDDYIAALKNKLSGKKIGLPIEYYKTKCDATILTALEQTKKIFEDCGAEFVDISLPHFDLGLSAYYILTPAECSSNLARFDGVRYGERCDQPKNLEDLYCRSRDLGFGDEVKRRILIGTYVLSSGFIDAYYRQAQRIRRLIRGDFISAFEKVDLILTPTTPSPAFKLGEEISPSLTYAADIFTIGVNLAGLPAIGFPIGFEQGLPLGGQLIGDYFKEGELLNAVHHYQQQTDWHSKIAEGF